MDFNLPNFFITKGFTMWYVQIATVYYTLINLFFECIVYVYLHMLLDRLAFIGDWYS